MFLSIVLLKNTSVCEVFPYAFPCTVGNPNMNSQKAISFSLTLENETRWSANMLINLQLIPKRTPQLCKMQGHYSQSWDMNHYCWGSSGSGDIIRKAVALSVFSPASAIFNLITPSLFRVWRRIICFIMDGFLSQTSFDFR